MFYNTYYSKTVPKGVCFLETFQKCIFEVLERIFHVLLIVPKGVPFETRRKRNPLWIPFCFVMLL
ncbi:hypothetical protein CN535_30205 [Bacillus pseudomycoides]|nr:hypothetical protein BLX05_28125 [Bacillus pseudomycoides]PDY10489.1 hypothetical protein COO16_20345 [Bacillus pseudomycoides]PEU24551.1 hypothetical protein CN535_30205 [Bacillus pseudomycoides]PFY06867.1 hypothetical protein COL42_28735 [Bacillus pseudomycoides]PGA65361.1 hypothetical protein COL89_28545 [Bacillus pseudomycoides]